MKILVINCGSSSLKYQLIDSESEAVLAKGLCERIGIDGRLVYQPAGGEKEMVEAAMPTHTEAIRMVLDYLVNEKTGILKSLDEVDAIGHRVLHGGAKLTSSVLIVVVLALRVLLRGRVSLRLQYAMWAVVLARLLFPLDVYKRQSLNRANIVACNRPETR